LFKPSRHIPLTARHHRVPPVQGGGYSVYRGNKKAAFCSGFVPPDKPSSDSNRRPPPYHGEFALCGRGSGSRSTWGFAQQLQRFAGDDEGCLNRPELPRRTRNLSPKCVPKVHARAMKCSPSRARRPSRRGSAGWRRSSTSCKHRKGTPHAADQQTTRQCAATSNSSGSDWSDARADAPTSASHFVALSLRLSLDQARLLRSRARSRWR
jgi:hypothetical protein